MVSLAIAGSKRVGLLEALTQAIQPTLAIQLAEGDRMARTKPRSDKVLTIRIPEKDLKRLEAFCIEQEKTKTEVIRSLIQQLEVVSAPSIES